MLHYHIMYHWFLRVLGLLTEGAARARLVCTRQRHTGGGLYEEGYHVLVYLKTDTSEF